MSTRSNGPRRDSQPSGQQLECETCGRAFTRNEHLRRHELTHAGERQFRCTVCGRQFVRKDALDRHVMLHQNAGPTLRQKGVRACSTCAASKAKCSGERPVCSRCHQRGEQACVYPDNRPPSAVNDEPVQDLPSLLNSITPNRPMTDGDYRTPANPQSQDQPGLSEGVAPQSVEAGPFNLNHFEPSYWDSGFTSTINWLPEEISFLSNDAIFNHPGDGNLFPLFDTLFENNVAIDGAAVQHDSFVSPTSTTHEPPSLTSSPQHASHLGYSPAQTAQSINSSSAVQPHVEGELYVDGQPARLPRVKRRKLTASTLVSTHNQPERYDLGFDTTDHHLEDDVLRLQLSAQAYDHIKIAFDLICVAHPDAGQRHDAIPGADCLASLHLVFSTKFEPNFPTKEVFEVLLHAYITSFHPLLPIFHLSSFQSLDWQLLLVACALGARFMDGNQPNPHLALSLLEFVRRLLFIGEEDESWLPVSTVGRAQLKLLFSVCMAYSSATKRWKFKHHVKWLPVDFCKDDRTEASRSQDLAVSSGEQWQSWKKTEERSRLSHTIWLVDCMLAIHSQTNPLLTLADVVRKLPCHEELWQAQTADEWLSLWPRYSQTSTLNEALYDIYVQKRLSSQIGEFSRVLIIHGLFHRMWDVGSYSGQALSHWMPTAHKPNEDPSGIEKATWLPSLPIFARWRNATCDSIDILHWSANAAIGTASGIEHPTVLHLHFSRVVLLTPYKHIVALAEYLVRSEADKSNGEINSDKQIVRRWAVQDQFKARLAMIHAAVLLWHVRRYSANGFYEPTSVAMSTLALWAFSLFADKARSSKRGSRSGASPVDDQHGSDSEEARCEIILLDRPTDDELVQQYVKEGGTMQAILKGVGNLCGPKGPERVLVEGRKLLKTLTLWGISEYWISLFGKLIAVSRRER